MKRTYINPQTVIVNVETQGQLLTFSPGTGTDTINGGGNRGDYTGSGQLSRDGGSFSDDEE